MGATQVRAQSPRMAGRCPLLSCRVTARVRAIAAIAAANTGGEPAAQTYSALNGSPGRGRNVVPGIGGPGLKRNDVVRWFQRWTSRYMVYQLHTQAAPLITATTR